MKKEEGHKKAREKSKALSQGWTAVCDRHPGARSDVKDQLKAKREKKEERENKG